MSKNVRVILQACKKPQKFSELKKLVPISKVSLYENLKRLQEKGLIEKLPDGRYVLTEEGRNLAEELEVYELVREILARHGASDLKASLELALRLDRQPRVDALVNLLKILLLVRDAYYVGLVSTPPNVGTELSNLIHTLKGHLERLGVDPFENDPWLRDLDDLEALRRNKDEATTLPPEKIANMIENTLEFIKDLQKKIDLEKLTPEERRLVTQASPLIDRFLRQARAKVKVLKPTKDKSRPPRYFGHY